MTLAPPPTRTASVSQLGEFRSFCEKMAGRRFPDHAAFHEFSVADYRRFWQLFLRWAGLLYDGSPDEVCTDDRCEHAAFFPDLRLNYAENLLRIDSPADGDRLALVAHHADRPAERLTRRQLRARVLAAAEQLRRLGVGPGDRVAAVTGNNVEAVVGGLAAAAVGATFSSAGPEMGVPALLSRFEQIAPKLLMANLTSAGEASATALSERVGDVARALPSLRAVVAFDDGPEPTCPGVQVEALAKGDEEVEPRWERFPFNHPLFVLFSSGTTGRPKCIVHGAGGTLLEHVKEHRLHVDLGLGDKLFFHTSAAWMMWNWQLSALASGSEIVLYDGPLTGPDTLWRLVSDERVSVFGTGPPYLQLCEDSGFSPRQELALPKLRAILSTGSILHDWQYDWVHDSVGPVPLQSISGGTDIIGCFVLGNPDLPVHRGWIQCRSLALDVQSLPPESEIGELVCRNPFPSRPLGLLGDDGAVFHEVYFSQNPGVWTHGDLVEFDEKGQARMQGRSDSVLNVGGFRIGPSELYRALREVPEVGEALAVEQDDPDERGRSRIVLLVVLRRGAEPDGRLTVRIRRAIARNSSPAHVPELVVRVDDLPTTHSGKRSERAARDAVNRLPVANTDALRNPASLAAITQAVALAAERRRRISDAPAPAEGAPTEARLRAIWESVLGVRPLLPYDDFFDLGGTSLAAVRVFHAIHERLGVDLPLSTLLRARTPAALAAVIDSPSDRRVPTLVKLRPGGGGRPLFLTHTLNGDVLMLRQLALALDTERPIYGLQARGLDPGEEPQTSVEEMAETYVEAIRSVQPTGPYTLAGFSFGGLVALEMARRLTNMSENIDWVGLIDTDVHYVCLPRLRRWGFRLARPLQFLRSALAAPRTRLPVYARRALLRTMPSAPVAPPKPEWDLPPLLWELEEIGWRAFRAYRPGRYDGSVTLFLADERRPGLCDPRPVFSRTLGRGLRVERLPGEHSELVQEPRVADLAKRVVAAMERADQTRA